MTILGTAVLTLRGNGLPNQMILWKQYFKGLLALNHVNFACRRGGSRRPWSAIQDLYFLICLSVHTPLSVVECKGDTEICQPGTKGHEFYYGGSVGYTFSVRCVCLCLYIYKERDMEKEIPKKKIEYQTGRYKV